RISAKHFELVTGFNHDQFPGRGDAEKPAVRPYWGTKIITADPFLVADFPTGRTQARQDASVAPKPNKLAHRNAGRHIRHRFFDTISQFRFAPRGRISGPDSSNGIGSA